MTTPNRPCICGCGKVPTSAHGFMPGHDSQYLWREAKSLGYKNVVEVVQALRKARFYR